MKRIVWTAAVSLAMLIALGCGKTETTKTPAPTTDARAGDSGKTPQGVESGDQKPAGEAGVTKPPEEVGATKPADDVGTPQQPAEGDTGKKPQGSVPGAIGKALLKGITGGSGAKKNEAEEAPKPEQ
jgi:hypothetical protein